MALLTYEQLEELRQIIRDASTALAISTTGMEVSDEELQRLIDEGYITKDDLKNFVLDSFEYGRLVAKLPVAAQMNYTEFKRYLEKNPIELSKREKVAYETAVDRAGQYCVGLGTRMSGEATNEAIQLSDKLAKEFLQGIKDEVSYSIVRRDNLNQLTTHLRQMSEDWARDWRRIASTETQFAHEQGKLEATIENHGEGALMAKVPEPTACVDCKRLYLDENGLPIIRPASWWHAQGVSNAGLKRNDWKPVLGAVHPWCQCRLTRVPEGYVFNEQWDLIPESMTKKSVVPHRLEKAAYKLHYRTKWNGLPISIENRKGSKRYWYDKETDTKGETLMHYPYGYIRLTEAADGDHVDVFIGPDENAKFVYVVHQMKAPSFTEYDEDKCMLGFKDRHSAKKAYLMHFDKPGFFGDMIAIPTEKFIERCKSGQYRKGEKIEKARPPGRGWMPIPGGHTTGGYRRRKGNKYEYWYDKKRIDKFDKDFLWYHNRNLERTERYEKLLKLGGEYKTSHGSYIAILPDPSEPGKIRTQYFDEHGFSGHQTFDDMKSLIKEMASEIRSLKPAPGILDKLSSTKNWREGMLRADIMQIINNIPYNDNYGKTHGAIHQFWNEHGIEKTASMLKEHANELKAGETPKVLEQYVKKSQIEKSHIFIKGPFGLPSNDTEDLIALFKSTYSADGLFFAKVNLNRPPVTTMGNMGQPARTANDNNMTPNIPDEHPLKKKRKKRKKTKEPQERKRRLVIAAGQMGRGGNAKPIPDYRQKPPPDRQADKNKDVFIDEMERRSKRREMRGEVRVTRENNK